MKRREFIILSGIGATSASLLSACGHPEEKLIPAFIPDDEYVPGIDYWKASTCGMCAAGCGIIVRTREHKANKIEGNPLHPVNRGALCARGQAGLEVLYNPDRIKAPMKRVGERGEGKWEEISWDDAIKTLADKLREIKAQGQQRSSAFITSDSRGVTAHVAARLMDAYGSRAILSFPLFNGYAMDAGRDSFGSAVVPDIANATYLLSFGSRFLETSHSPVMHSLAYGEFRQTRGRARGKFVHVEPRMSLTAANADEWLPAAAGSEGLVALAIAQVLVRENLAKAPVFLGFTGILEDYAPEKVAEVVDLPAEKLIRIANEFANSERPLAIGSGDAAGLRRINLLNVLADNLDKKGGVIRQQRSSYYGPLEALRPPDRFLEIYQSDWPRMLETDNFSALLIHRVNPFHLMPAIRDKIKAIPFIAGFSSFMDETMQFADLVLPDHTSFESWDIHSSYPTTGGMVVTLTQPVARPQFDTRQTTDVLFELSRQLGGEGVTALPYQSAEELIKQSVAGLSKHRGSISSEAPEEFWTALAERGVWIGEPETKEENAAKPATESLLRSFALGEIDYVRSQNRNAETHDLRLLLYEDPSFGDGSLANLPSLQELPDPMTSVMWGSWVEINPKTASSLGIADGDLVEVSTEYGSLRVPAVLYPAIRPNVIAMPFGQGHIGYGRYATNRGANPAVLNPGLQGTVGAKVSKVEGKASLIRFGTDLQEVMEKKPWR